MKKYIKPIIKIRRIETSAILEGSVTGIDTPPTHGETGNGGEDVAAKFNFSVDTETGKDNIIWDD